MNFRQLYSVIYRFYLETDILFPYFYKEIDIEQSVPFVRSWSNREFQNILQLTINSLNFRLIAFKCSIDYKLQHIINTILLCYAVYFCLYNF